MLLIMCIVAFAVVFIAGMHYAMWDNGMGDFKSLCWSVGLSLIGVYDIITIIGYVKNHV